MKLLSLLAGLLLSFQSIAIPNEKPPELSPVEKQLFGKYILIVSGICDADVITLIPLNEDPQVFAWFEESARKWRLTLELNAIQVFTAIKRDNCV